MGSPVPFTETINPFEGLDPCSKEDQAVFAVGLPLLLLRFDRRDPDTIKALELAVNAFGITLEQLCERIMDLAQSPPPGLRELFTAAAAARRAESQTDAGMPSKPGPCDD